MVPNRWGVGFRLFLLLPPLSLLYGVVVAVGIVVVVGLVVVVVVVVVLFKSFHLVEICTLTSAFWLFFWSLTLRCVTFLGVCLLRSLVDQAVHV